MTVSLAAIVAIAAVVLVIRAGGDARRRAGQAAGAIASGAAPSRAADATTGVPESGAGKVREVARPVDPSPTRAAVRVVEIASAPATTPKGPCTLDVGGYPDLQVTFDERDRLEQLTGIEGWVVPATEGGNGTNRIVLGIYRSYARAEAAANMLLRSRTLPEVTVVPLPPRSARR